MKKDIRKYDNALKYSGVGLQIMATVGLGFFLGYQLDKFLGLAKPYFTALLSIVFVFIGLYAGLKDFFKNSGS